MKATPEEITRKLNLPIVKVSLGCGLHAKEPFEAGPSKDWINQDGCENQFTDIVCTWDAIPLPDKCADHVELGDVCEHLPAWTQDKIWKEWTRIMKVGCTIHVSTPNLHRACVGYAQGIVTLENLIQQLYAWQTGPYEQHYITYTVETLTALLEKYGFGEIDFSESPGDNNPDRKMSWWLVCSAKKLRDI